jgi:Flp pilus assembly pilin Flp
MQFIARFFSEEEGAELTEWALLLVVLAIAFLTGGPAVGDALEAALGAISGQVSDEADALAAIP